MYEIVSFFWKVCCFTQGPQDAPYSRWMLRLTVYMYVFISILLLKISANWQDSILQLIVEVLSVLIFIAVILQISGKINRFNQTAMSIFGTDALISFMALPLFSAIAAGEAWDITYILVLLLMFWHWLVSGHIIRHALDKNLMTGLGIAFLYIYGSFHLMTGLFS